MVDYPKMGDHTNFVSYLGIAKLSTLLIKSSCIVRCMDATKFCSKKVKLHHHLLYRRTRPYYSLFVVLMDHYLSFTPSA